APRGGRALDGRLRRSAPERRGRAPAPGAQEGGLEAAARVLLPEARPAVGRRALAAAGARRAWARGEAGDLSPEIRRQDAKTPSFVPLGALASWRRSPPSLRR